MANKTKPVEHERSDGEQLSELELTLTVLWNSVRRWLSQRSNSTTIKGLSDLDVFLLHLLVYRNKPMRATDLAFALAIEDIHLVTYSLKKTVKLGLAGGRKVGKEVFYSHTEKGREHYTQFLDDRAKYLEPAIKFVRDNGVGFKSLNEALRALSGVYEQAARAAASAREP